MISKKALERAEEWNKTLKMLINSKKSLTYVLDDESKDLIEDMTARIAIAIELKKEEKKKEELDDMNENNDWDWDYERNI